MIKDPEKLFQARRDEIVAACAKLYETMGFKDVTIKEIATFTTFTRPSIYNYFQTKEEIFLLLFQREYEAWASELDTLQPENEGDRRIELAEQIARTLERRECLLKLLSNNMGDMEMNSRMENLVKFKRAYNAADNALRRCLVRFCRSLTTEQVDNFMFSFMPLMYGLYPYAVINDRQKECMKEAGVTHRFLSIYELAFLGIKQLLGVGFSADDSVFIQ